MSLSPDALAARQALPLFAPGHAFHKAIKPAKNTALRTVLSAATAAQIPEELTILLRYQAARKVISQDLRGQLQKQLTLCEGRAPKDASMQMRHIVAFLGQCVRLHRAINEEQSGGRP